MANKSEEQMNMTAALKALTIVATIIYEAKEIPSGHLYARLMHKVDHETYDALIRRLEAMELIRRTPGHLLQWIGPVDLKPQTPSKAQ